MQRQAFGYGVASLVASRFSSNLIRTNGYFRGSTADRWLQFHDVLKLPANGALPLKSYSLPQTAPFHWGFDPGTLQFKNGIVLAVSDTEGTLTISSDLADFLADFHSDQAQLTATAHVGNAAVADEILDIVTSSGVVYRVLAVKTSVVGECFFQLFDVNEASLVSGTTKPVMEQHHIDGSQNVVYEFNFGANGLTFAKCCIALSSTGGVYTALGANSAYLQGVTSL